MRFLRMNIFFISILVCVMSTAVSQTFLDGVSAECLQNMVRFTVDGSLLVGNQVEVSIIDDNSLHLLTPALAAQCGYIQKSDPMGNLQVDASLYPCGHSIKDGGVDVSLQLRSNIPDVLGIHAVSKTCSYQDLASREVLCAPNFMEVSVELDLPTTEELTMLLPGLTSTSPASKSTGKRSPFRLQKVAFHTPEGEKTFTPQELLLMGIGLYTSSTRLLLRTPYDTITAYAQNVATIPMSVIRSSVHYKHRWVSSVLNTEVACPTGGVSFPHKQISWFLPRVIGPMLDDPSRSPEIVELYVGFQGKRMDLAELEKIGHAFHITESHLVFEMPVGSPHGHYRSLVQKGIYYTTFTIEPMIEMLWRESSDGDETRYRVMMPVKTPPTPHKLYVEDHTEPGKGVFMIVVGSVLPDVDLVTISTSVGVLSMEQAAAEGFVIREHILTNGTKSFSLQVAFSHPAVLIESTTGHSRSLSIAIEFGFVVLPELVLFSYRTVLQTTDETARPTVSGTCDREHFYITVHYGGPDHDFKTLIGHSLLTPKLANQFEFHENETHFSLKVPFGSAEVVYEAVEASSVKGRLDVSLEDVKNGVTFQMFSLACFFTTTIIECSPNGIVGALAVKLEAVHSLNPSQLSLNDPTCGPLYSNERYAFFFFSVNRCGTTREFEDGMLVYRNRATVKDAYGNEIQSETEPEYRFVFTCVYSVNTNKTLAFNTVPQRKAPVAQIGVRDLLVRMRLARDDRFIQFYSDKDYPVLRYVKEPLYFQIEVEDFQDTSVHLIAKHCWATFSEDRNSKPRWDIITDGCPNIEDPEQTIFHPVKADHRVKVPSHVKRFEVKMFSFAEHEDSPPGQTVFHCDVVLCDPSSPSDSLCYRPCASQQMSNDLRRGRRDAASVLEGKTSPVTVFLV